MKKDIESYSETTKQNQLKKNKVKNNSSFEYNFYNTISGGLAESEYAINDEYYERKKEIVNQIENSSIVERYVSMLFFNYSYEYYGSVTTDEIEYYGIFLQIFLIGVFGTMFYLFNINKKEYDNITFLKDFDSGMH